MVKFEVRKGGDSSYSWYGSNLVPRNGVTLQIMDGNCALVLSSDDTHFYCTKRFYEVDDEGFITVVDAEKLLIAEFNGDEFHPGEGLECFIERIWRIVNPSEFDEFMGKTLKFNKRIYSLFLCNYEFNQRILKEIDNVADARQCFLRNLLSSSISAMEKVLAGCSTEFFIQNMCKQEMGLENQKKLNQVLGLPTKVLKFLSNQHAAGLYQDMLQLAKNKNPSECLHLVEYYEAIMELSRRMVVYNAGHIMRFIGTVLETSLMCKNSSTKNLLDYLHNQALFYGCQSGLAVPTNEAIELRDYLHIAKKFGLDVEERPSNLRAAHWYIQQNVFYAENDEKETEFAEAVEKYRHLEWTDGKYSVLAPKNIKDLIREGTKMHHCIASYVDFVCNGSVVLFLRKNDAIEEPLVSFEVDRDLEFVQIKGKFDVDIVESEDNPENSEILAVLEKWRKDNG